MEFNTVDEAWMFWVSYGGQKGFEVRKRYSNKRKSDGKVRSCRYVCANEGHRKEDKRDHLTKCPRAETRTDCQVRMGVVLDQEKGNYKVADLVLEHNHILQLPETSHLMVSQRKISELQGFEIETADDAGIGPKAAHQLASIQVGGSLNLNYTLRDHKNYLQGKRQREMVYGQAGSMLMHFQDKIAKNPSFQYALQMDSEEQIANIFWVDAKMLTDYAYFGDVVSFDTTFGTNKESRPFGVFVGFNQFRETMVFGAVLLYDETYESFKWLFETFLKAHNGKQPKTIYTDQDSAMGKAIKKVFLESWHGLCTFHIMQNAVKHVAELEDEESSNSPKQTAEDNEEEQSILTDFSACMFEYEDEETFEQAFSTIRAKASKQSWLDSIYKVKEKWAECYMKDVFTLGMRSTQLSESVNSELKRHFKSDFDIIRFLQHFERVVEDKRENELNAEFESRKKIPRIKMRTPMLIQASKLYTPIIFEAFQAEYERSMVACTTALEGNNCYLVAIGSLDENCTFEKEYKVVGDPLEQTSTCGCGMFSRTGILCAHALKVLDLMNIKSLPSQYVLKRWTRGARSGTVQDNHGRSIIENPRLNEMLRYKDMTRKFLNLALRAASHPGSTLLVNNALDILTKQVEEEINGFTDTIALGPTDITPPSDLVSTARLKKKEVETKTSKRKKNWLDKLHKSTNNGSNKGGKRKKKGSKEQKTAKTGGKKKGKEASVHDNPAGQNIYPSTSLPMEEMSEPYMAINTFSQLLTGATVDDLDVEF
nr:protein FAR1-RELATED SEQUENCE 5-like [Oryza sativa Japonica Group]